MPGYSSRWAQGCHQKLELSGPQGLEAAGPVPERGPYTGIAGPSRHSQVCVYSLEAFVTCGVSSEEKL
eukprot:1159575-Pelagomonas_calceolata.AAC.5